MSAAEWIAKRRELLDAATEGPWETDGSEITQHWSRPEPWRTVASSEVVCGSYCYGGAGRGIERATDAALIADARTSLPRALDALEAVLRGHRPVSFSFSWQTGVTMHEVCETCQDKAGTHPCGCWRDEDQPHVCAVCSDPERHIDAPWPCMTVRTIESALRAEP